MDWHLFRIAAATVSVIAFNVPIGIAALRLQSLQGFGDALREKDPTGHTTGDVSYSRVTGIVGTVVVASLFWIMSNIVIATAIISPRDVANILSSISTIFLVGAALFLPYGFNQLKTLLQ